MFFFFFFSSALQRNARQRYQSSLSGLPGRVGEIENTLGRRAQEIAKNFWNFSPRRYYSPLGVTFNKNNRRKERKKEKENEVGFILGT